MARPEPALSSGVIAEVRSEDILVLATLVLATLVLATLVLDTLVLDNGGGSVYGGASPLQMAGTLPGTPMVSSPMLPGSPLSVMGGGVPYAGNVGLPASYGGGYGGTYGGGYGGGYGTPGYEHLGLPNAGYPMGGHKGPGTPASGMMVIHQPEGHHRRHSRRHRHHSHSHRRHRSHDRY